MASELQWLLTRQDSCFIAKRSGIVFSRHPANLMNKHCFKYDGLVQPSVTIQPTESGVSVIRRSLKAPVNQIAKANQSCGIVKNGSSATFRAQNVGRDLLAHGYRLDLIPAAQARMQALLRATAPRKNYVKKMRANKLAKLTAQKD